MPLTHNSKLADSEPMWSDVDKTTLPYNAFCWEAPGTDENKKSTWKYPHHFVVGENMYLHKGGLDAAWAAAQGARSGEKAPQEVIDHLQKHRNAISSKTAPAERLTKRIEDAKIEAKIDDSESKTLYMEGYASTWDNEDLVGDIMRKGSFSKTIKERVSSGKVLLMVKHIGNGGDTMEAIGLVIKAKEDDYGLWFRAELYDTELARETHGKVKRSPNAFGTSVGFKPIKYNQVTTKSGDEAFEFLENALYEITVTASPCNTETSIEAKRNDINDILLKRIDALEAKVNALQEKSGSVTADDVGDNSESSPETSKAESGFVSSRSKRERTLALLKLNNDY